MAASSNLFDTSTTTIPPYHFAGILEGLADELSSNSSSSSGGVGGGSGQEGGHGEEDEDVATWAALVPARRHARPPTSSASSSLSDEGEGGAETGGEEEVGARQLASIRIGERAATPEMRRGGLALTPRGFELDDDDWDEGFYYYYSDGFGVGEVRGWVHGCVFFRSVPGSCE